MYELSYEIVYGLTRGLLLCLSDIHQQYPLMANKQYASQSTLSSIYSLIFQRLACVTFFGHRKT